jgi:PIN domain nuclease of toxin-antitoxin system
MKYLADTHILLWAIEDDEKLPAAARDIFLDEKSEIYYSFANIWEVAIKHSLNKGGVPFSAEQFNILCARSGYLQLMTKNNHAIAVESLCYDKENAPREHRDPFDRLSLAQAKSEKMGFITHDELIPFYNEGCVVKV